MRFIIIFDSIFSISDVIAIGYDKDCNTLGIRLRSLSEKVLTVSIPKGVDGQETMLKIFEQLIIS